MAAATDVWLSKSCHEISFITFLIGGLRVKETAAAVKFSLWMFEVILCSKTVQSLLFPPVSMTLKIRLSILMLSIKIWQTSNHNTN